MKSELSCHALRLHPDDNLVTKLKEFVSRYNISAACILTCVGSLKKAKLRLAGASANNENCYVHIDQSMEIVSLVGTLSALGGMHLHISLADKQGKVVGGHLMNDDAIVDTTAEVVIGSCEGMTFNRIFDKKTGFNELMIE